MIYLCMMYDLPSLCICVNYCTCSNANYVTLQTPEVPCGKRYAIEMYIWGTSFSPIYWAQVDVLYRYNVGCVSMRRAQCT